MLLLIFNVQTTKNGWKLSEYILSAHTIFKLTMIIIINHVVKAPHHHLQPRNRHGPLMPLEMHEMTTPGILEEFKCM